MRDVTVQISSSVTQEAAEWEARVLEAIPTFQRIGWDNPGVSVTFGWSIFRDGARERMARITLHSVMFSEEASALWRVLRREIPGVDCGRIEDEGKSWCAKTYGNTVAEGYGEEQPWPEDNYEPTELA
jgi:hypothetical protein